MSTFHAYNIEYDSSDSEVDDTKELQIEEALKLYQNALKLHSEGPDSYPEAAKAYSALFRSEIFTYPDSLSEFRRSETLSNYDELLADAFDPGAGQPLIASAETAPNTLPQILHLSYKNHGQFVLDFLSWRVRKYSLENPEESFGDNTAKVAKKPLNYFAEALDKDENDLDLWRQSAFAARLAGSYRIARFCLESVLDGEELDSGLLDSLGIDETLSLHQLQSLAKDLQDDLSVLLEPLSAGSRRKLSAILMQMIDQYPEVPRPSVEIAAYSEVGHYGKKPAKYLISPPKQDWVSVGRTIFQQCVLQQGEAVDVGPGPGVGFKIRQRSPSADASKAQNSAVLPILESKSKSAKSALERSTEAEVAVDSEEPGPDDLVKSEEQTNQEQITSVPVMPKALTKNADGKEDAKGSGAEAQEGNSDPQPSRKRSTESAGLPEVPDGGRVRSKRIRATKTFHEENELTLIESAKDTQSKQELQQYLYADQVLYETVDPRLSQFDANGIIQPDLMREMVNSDENFANEGSEPLFVAIQDAYEMIQNPDPEGTRTLVKTMANAISSLESRRAGLKAFNGHDEPTYGGVVSTKKSLLPSDLNLTEWVSKVNNGWTLNHEAAWFWLEALLRPGTSPSVSSSSISLYLDYQWTDQLKQTVMDIMVATNEYLFRRAEDELDQLQHKILSEMSSTQSFSLDIVEEALIDMIQTLFELHLDIYSSIKSVSGTESNSAMAESQRLDRWATLATSAVKLGARLLDEESQLDHLSLRHIWAQAFRICTDDDTTQEHMVACIRELKSIMESGGRGVTVQLPNSAVIAEISLFSAKERLRKMNMKDFFLRVFDEGEQDPVIIIESLEPLLEASMGITSTDDDVATGGDDSVFRSSSNSQKDAALTETQAFIANGTLSLRLALWRRLRDAYESIDYLPKVVSCNLRIIEIVMKELSSSAYTSQTNQRQRIKMLMRYLHIVDDALGKIVPPRKSKEADFLDCIDDEHLKSSVRAVCQLLNILQSCRLADDLVAAELISMPSIEGRNISYNMLRDKIDAMIVHGWLVQYFLFREATIQFYEVFKNPEEDLVEFLRSVHFSIGVRGACDVSNKLFLKVTRNELLGMEGVPGAAEELCQILFDLYDIKCFQNPLDAAQHEIVDHEPLTRQIALKILPTIINQAKKVPMKDLPRSDIKTAIDKVKSALGTPTPASGAAHMNRRMCTSYIKSPINPIRLRNCVEGQYSLPTKPTLNPGKGQALASDASSESEFFIAQSGWYFLVGSISLAKWRGQKRVTAGSTEDLEEAAKFLLHDLEHRSSESWETWFRLGQTYDALLEEQVSWSAEKMNAGLATMTPAGQPILPYDVGLAGEIVDFQRRTINCFAMAVSCLIRNGSGAVLNEAGLEDPKTRDVISTLYTEFGNRLYAASREPFCMRAFQVREQEERYFNRTLPGQTMMFKAPPFKALKDYNIWKLASRIFREAANYKETWWNYYMLSKSLWKVYACKELPPKLAKPDLQDLLDALFQAIAVLPRRDSRKEPIIEPHYKIVTIVHKIVMMGDLDPQAAAEYLRSATSYARKVAIPTDDSGEEGWEEYVLGILKTLRNVDKSGWHHRMTARAAHIIYEGSNKDVFGAMGAKHELTQSVFTKTMILQVWKPEFERTGRHFVFTTRYVRFFCELLDKTTDRMSYDSLLKRIRKKSHDFFNHEELWKDVVLQYLKMLRRHGSVPENHVDTVFHPVSPDEFVAKSTALEKWCFAPGRESKLLDILRSAVEIKKINLHLLKPPTLFDDLIGDIYALMFQEIMPELQVEPVTRAGTATPTTVDSTAKTDGQQLNLVLLNNLAEKSGATSDANATASGRIRTRVLKREVLRKAEATGYPLSLLAAMNASIAYLRREEDQSDTPGANGGNTRLKRRRSEVSAGKDRSADEERSHAASLVDNESELSELSDLEGELEIDEERQEATITGRRRSVVPKVEDPEKKDDADDEQEAEDEAGDYDIGEGEGDEDVLEAGDGEDEEELYEDALLEQEDQNGEDVDMEDANGNVEMDE